jgi:uncharacterized protein YacL
MLGIVAVVVIGVAAFAGAWLGTSGRGHHHGGKAVRGDGAPKLVDTSALIDGRIADVAEAGFLEGRLLVPEFVLAELQTVADAGNPLRRGRGKRGFDVLDRLRAGGRVAVEVVSRDVGPVPDVDGKLVELARTYGADLVTTDHNLQRLAQTQGVTVLNVNALVLALKPPVTVGDSLRVQVVKEGREFGQGVGYLDDGTMVVVEHGRAHVGRTVDATVVSVLQTAAGRMVFTRVAGAERAGATGA